VAVADFGAACAIAGSRPDNRTTPAAAAPNRRIAGGTDNGLKVSPLRYGLRGVARRWLMLLPIVEDN
jgi:hypothetical protein